MDKIKVSLKNNSYDIIIGQSLIKNLSRLLNNLKIGKDAIIITNPFLKGKFANQIEKNLKVHNFFVKTLVVPDSEKSKSAVVAFKLINEISKIDAKKKFFIIALGGGVIGDLAGFVASIYKRGIAYVQIPTTLLAQIDSSIGGKTAINLAGGKNLIGAFYQPKLVLCDVDFLKSLNRAEIISGLAEAIKYGIIEDAKLFQYIENNIEKFKTRNLKAFLRVVSGCAKIKAKIVSLDEKETLGIRTVLNLGHTIGHAIEAAAGYGRWRHGEAVAIGLLCASDISFELSIISKAEKERIESLIKIAGLPVRIKNLKLADILKAHYKDKKFIGSTNRFVLPVKVGKVIIKKNIDLDVIKKVIRARLV